MNGKHFESDPSSHQNTDPPKLPFRRLEHALNQVVNIAIPLHVRQLNEHGANILQLRERPLELRSAQLKATNCVNLLKQDLFELNNLNRQVRDVDQDMFQRRIVESLKSAVETLSNFMSVHPDVLGPFSDMDSDAVGDSGKFLGVVCDSQGIA